MLCNFCAYKIHSECLSGDVGSQTELFYSEYCRLNHTNSISPLKGLDTKTIICPIVQCLICAVAVFERTLYLKSNK